MRILTKTRKFFNALRCLFTKWNAEECRKAGIDTRYNAEIEGSSGSLLQDAFRSVSADRLIKYESKLESAAESFRQIECLTNGRVIMFLPEIEKIHELAQTAYRKTQK